MGGADGRRRRAGKRPRGSAGRRRHTPGAPGASDAAKSRGAAAGVVEALDGTATVRQDAKRSASDRGDLQAAHGDVQTQRGSWRCRAASGAAARPCTRARTARHARCGHADRRVGAATAMDEAAASNQTCGRALAIRRAPPRASQSVHGTTKERHSSAVLAQTRRRATASSASHRLGGAPASVLAASVCKKHVCAAARVCDEGVVRVASPCRSARVRFEGRIGCGDPVAMACLADEGSVRPISALGDRAAVAPAHASREVALRAGRAGEHGAGCVAARAIGASPLAGASLRRRCDSVGRANGQVPPRVRGVAGRS